MKVRVAAALVVVLAGAGCAGCKERRRTGVLSSLVTDQEAPAYAELAARCRSLAEAAAYLADAPGEATLAAARGRWQEALAAWYVTFPFRPPALTKLAPHFHATYWPTEPRLLRAALAGDRQIDQRFVDELGVSAKGMYALEALLYGAPKDPAPPLAALQAAGPEGVRRRGVLRALAADVAKIAGEAEAIIAGRGFAGAFGREGQPALNRLVNDQVAVLEGLVTERLAFMAGAFESGSLAVIPFQGRQSASSYAIALAQLRGVAAIYAPEPGGGLSRLVRVASEEADAAVASALGRALASVKSLGGPLEEAVRRDPQAVTRAAGDVRALEVLFKTNVASALGVTLTFSAGDGD